MFDYSRRQDSYDPESPDLLNQPFAGNRELNDPFAFPEMYCETLEEALRAANEAAASVPGAAEQFGYAEGKEKYIPVIYCERELYSGILSRASGRLMVDPAGKPCALRFQAMTEECRPGEILQWVEDLHGDLLASRIRPS